MPAAKRVKPSDFFTPEDWRLLSHRSDLMGLGAVAHAWTVIALSMALTIWQPWFALITVPVIGTRQLGLAVLMHEAAHGGLSKRSKLNDFVGQWIVGAPVGADLKSYRDYHLQHHKFAQQPEDPDLNLSAPFPITSRSLRRKIIRDLTGQTFFKQRRNQIANAFGIGIRPGKGTQNRMTAARNAAFPFLGANAVLFLGLTLLGVWWSYFLLWLLPMATWNQLVTRLRNIAEHAVLSDSDDPLKQARTTKANWLERALIAPYAVNFHCEHHMFMHLPFYRLRAAHRLLEAGGHTAYMEIGQGYRDVLGLAASRKDVAGVPA
jgi:fatty acid desaturase